MKEKSIKKNAILNGIRTVLNVLFPLITFPYISRVLSVDEIGIFNFSGSVVSYFMLLAGLGFSQYAIREGTKYRNSREEISKFASRIFNLNIISTIISYVILVILILFSSKLQSYTYCILIISVQIAFTTIGMEWLYSIFEEYTYITVRSIVFKIISIALLFIFVRNEGDILAYSAISVFACVGSNILNFVNCKKYCDIKIGIFVDYKEIIIPIIIIFASNVAIQIYVNSDITMLGYMKDDYSVGIYSVSTKIYGIVKNVLTAVLTVTIPRFSLFAGLNKKEEFHDLLQKVIKTLWIICIPAVAGLICENNNIITIISGSKYLESSTSFIILSCAIIFAIFNGLLNNCILLAYKREKIFLYCTIVSAILNVFLNFFMIPMFDEIGAAITTFISELILFILLYLFSKDILGKSFYEKSVLTSIGSIGIVFVCIISNKYIDNVYIQTILAVISSGIIYLLFLLLFKNDIICDVLNRIGIKIKK